MFRPKVADESTAADPRYPQQKQQQPVCKEVFPEDHEPWRKRILDPASDIVLKWNRVFLVSSLLALVIDPLYFFLPSVRVEKGADFTTSCVWINWKLSVAVTVLRSVTDLFYVLQMVIRFRTAYVAPSTRVFGRGELVMDPGKIARRYLRSDFFVDMAAVMPLPQILIWLVIPAIKHSDGVHSNSTVALIVLIQYIPRLYLIFPLSYQIIKATGVVTKTAWAGAAYNLLLYMIASHVVGAAFFILTIERQTTCWKSRCNSENGTMGSPVCYPRYLDCDYSRGKDWQNWANSTNVFTNCDATNNDLPFNFGVFTNALSAGAVSSPFIKQYFFCLWWGLQNLSTYGQGLTTSTFIGETSFAILISILGLVLFAHLIGNMQWIKQSEFADKKEKQGTKDDRGADDGGAATEAQRSTLKTGRTLDGAEPVRLWRRRGRR